VGSGIQAEVPVASPAYAGAARRRFDVTQCHVPKLRAPVLDLGPPNAFAREFEARDGVRIEHTDQHDLDREALPGFRRGPYATITAFEILEHVMNPLFILDGCREVLRTDGLLYVSVPRRNGCEWLFGRSPEHFHEFAADELRWLLDKSGFAIEAFATVNTSALGIGVRPLLRRMLRNLFIVRCRPRAAGG
jgi:hypothetical protein